MDIGKFVTFEGTEGVGKTTAIHNLCRSLDKQGIEYVRTREPGGSPFAEKLRALLLNPNTQINDDAELLLMFAARSDHMSQVILPALTLGRWVICDRFIESTIAYQGYGRGYGKQEQLKKIEQLISQFVPRLPDITLWLDLPIIEGMRRAGKRGTADRFEQEALNFFERVHQGFHAQQLANPERIKRINAQGNEQSVSDEVWQILCHYEY